jgi:hypothetical protein
MKYFIHSLIVSCYYSATANSEDQTQFNSSALKFRSWQVDFSKLNSIQSQSNIVTDSQLISKSWCRAPSGAHDQIFINVLTVMVLIFVGCLLWREDRSVFCICYWPLPAQSFSGPSPLGLATTFYCLRFETSLFFASCDSQGHARPSLHTGFATQFNSTELFFRPKLHGPRRNHCLSIVGKACLQRSCIATEITRLLLAYSLSREFVYWVVA